MTVIKRKKVLTIAIWNSDVVEWFMTDLAKAKMENPALLTLEDKFPEAKGAPVVSQAAKPVDMRVNMLGKVLRNVQCNKCGGITPLLSFGRRN